MSRLIQMEDDFMKYNTRNYYKTIKEEITKYQPPTLGLRNENGKIGRKNVWQETLKNY